MNKTKIILNKRKIIASSADDDFLNILLIVFIIDEFIGGKTTDVSLDQVAFVYDRVIKNKIIDGLSVKLSTPWAAPQNYRELIIMASEKDYVKTGTKNNGFTLSIGAEGADIIKEIKEQDLFTWYRNSICRAVKSFKKVDLNLQKLIW